MKKIKIIIGVLSILIGIVALIESYDVFRLAYAFGQDGFHIYVGFIVGLVFIGLGILSMVMTDEENNKKYAETAAALCSIAFFFCFRGPQIFTDLYYFAGWAVICFIFACVVYYKKEKSKEDVAKQPVSHLTSQKECPYCHAVVDGSSTFCGSCGKRIQKICPHCGAAVNNDDMFCKNCGHTFCDDSALSTNTQEIQIRKCNHCGAELNNSDTFCQNCGAKIDENSTAVSSSESQHIDESPSTEMTDSTQKKCAHCGSSINDDDVFCVMCGKKLTDEENAVVKVGSTTADASIIGDEIQEVEESSFKKHLPYILGVIAIIAICGGGWYGYKEYSAYYEKKQAREKFVADSLEKVMQEQIKLAAELEKERKEHEEIANFREKFTINNIINLLKHPEDVSLAQKCGLSLLYKDTIKEEGYGEGHYFFRYNYAYGYEVKKGKKRDSSGVGYEIRALSNHSCYFDYLDWDDVFYIFRFKDESDADYLFEMAKDNDLFYQRGVLDGWYEIWLGTPD